MFIGHLYVFGEMSVRSSTHFLIEQFVFLILIYMSCLYILEINPLSVAIVFSHSKGCLLILFIVSFAVEKLLCLIRSHLFIFDFIFSVLGGGSKRILLWFMSQNVVSMFSSKGFIASDLTFKTVIHSEFIFAHSIFLSQSSVDGHLSWLFPCLGYCE